MELYEKSSYGTSALITRQYSTSFSLACRLFPLAVRKHIFAIYAFARIGDEIVDTYRGENAARLLDQLRIDTAEAIESAYSTNPVIHSFALTARKYAINDDLIKPFFDSMQSDLETTSYDQQELDKYVYGSAEVIGLMCLKVFCAGNADLYSELEPGARRLGAAFQKVNFLRDYLEDSDSLGRHYFAATATDGLDSSSQAEIIADIQEDFTAALPAIKRLPDSSRPAVWAAYDYYYKLFIKLRQSTPEQIASSRIRLGRATKLRVLARAALRKRKGQPVKTNG